LKPYHRNPRQITKKKQARLTDTLARLGDLGGIVHNLETDEVIGGNQRMIVFQDGRVEITLTLPEPDEQGTVAHGFIIWKGHRFAYRLVKWDEATAAEANIAANIGAGDFDWDIVANSWEPSDLMAWGMDSEALTSWKRDVAALNNLIESEKPEPVDAEAQVDRAAALLEKWKVTPGSLWRIGEHRLLCGDSTKREDVERVMGGEKADMLLNDPPYGMRLNADFSGMVNHLDFAREKGVKNGNKYADVIGDDIDYDASPIIAMFQDVKEQFWWGADYYSESIGDTMHSGAWFVWDKRLDENADKMYGSCFELLWSKQKHKRDILRHKWAGIFGTEHEQQRGRMHPNQKPVELYVDLLTRFSEDGEIIVDCYAGSGTTLVACQNLNRRARAIEISPSYCSVILQRMTDAFEGIEIELLESPIAPTP
jgi:DNA modification methylase